eukprot:6069129-Prorocentrum_lima.AAC.1
MATASDGGDDDDKPQVSSRSSDELNLKVRAPALTQRDTDGTTRRRRKLRRRSIASSAGPLGR